jgi:Mg-chelatase subunit ChlI
LLDRFGLAVDVRTPTDLATRVQVVKRRDAFERDPEAFTARWKKDEDKTRRRIVAARERLAEVQVPDSALERAAQLCMALGTDGLRGELTLMRAARSLAALQGVDRGRRPTAAGGQAGAAAPAAPRPAGRCRCHRARGPCADRGLRQPEHAPDQPADTARGTPTRCTLQRCCWWTRPAWVAPWCAPRPARCATPGWPRCAA